MPDQNPTAAEIARSFDLRTLPQSFYDNPYATYRALRENDPVRRLPDGGVFLTRYADMERVYKDTSVFSSDKKIEFLPKFGRTPLYEHHTTSLIFNDPPLHTRVRKIINGALTPRTIAELEPDLVRLIDSLLDAMEKKARAGETVDLVDDYAISIPVEVIGNLLDVPHDERGPLRDWSLAILGALEPVVTQDMADLGNKSVADFVDYLKTLVARRREKPGNPERDVLTRLIQGEGDGDRLSEIELLQNCIFILNAGHETTTNLIGNGLALLLDYPQSTRRLVAEPDLIRTAVDEMLRFDSPVQLGNRFTMRDTEIGGVKVARGTSVNLCIGAANRDPDQFSDPDTFDIARAPNRHVAFASGPHQCIGVALARLEGRIAVSRFLARFPNFHYAGKPVRGGRARFRGFLKLPVDLGL
ncbi:MAG: cytochrome P450 [Hyphomicrobiales bacterium]|nr:cytochrome P450 [Hyphomicrobiales bacterium]